MTDAAAYEPPKIWQWDPNNNQAFSNINRPTAGAQQDKDLQVGKASAPTLLAGHAQRG